MKQLRPDQLCVRQAVARIGSNAAVWSAISRAITAIQYVPSHLRTRISPDNPVPVNDALKTLIRETESAVGLLHDADNSGYRLFYSYSLIAHWSYFEAFLDDYVLARIVSVNGLSEKLTADLGPSRRGWSSESIRSKLKDRTEEASFSSLMARTLNAIGLTQFKLSPEAAHTLDFSNSARNCLLHSAGLWDLKGCRSAGIDEQRCGTRVEIGMEEFLSCYDAVAEVFKQCSD
jgi:hypothetical protein